MQRSPTGHRDTGATELGERLRLLRSTAGPEPLSQRTIAGALGISAQQVSNLENGKQRPRREHLRMYALIFSAPEAFTGNKDPGALTDDALTPEQRENRDRLFSELMNLRGDSDSQPEEPASPAFWDFPDDGSKVVIIASRQLPELISAVDEADPRHPDHQKSLLMADPDAVLEVYAAIRAHNPQAIVEIVLSDRVLPDAFSNHVVIIGGAQVNQYTQWITDRMGLPIAGGVLDDPWTREFTVKPIEGELVPASASVDTKTGNWILRANLEGEVPVRPPGGSGTPKRVPALTRDIALIARQPNPLNTQATVTLLYGLFGRGTYCAAKVFSDPDRQEQNQEFLEDRLNDRERFWVLFWVESDRTAPTPTDVTTDLSNPDNVILISDQSRPRQGRP